MRNDEETWSEACRQPTVNEGEELLHNECGRIVRNDDKRPGHGVDCRSHAYSLIATSNYDADLVLAVKHGGGEERHALKYAWGFRAAMNALTSDQRYSVFKTIDATVNGAQVLAIQQTSKKYANAFVEGRLKKRRRNKRIFVEIEPATAPAQATPDAATG